MAIIHEGAARIYANRQDPVETDIIFNDVSSCPSTPSCHDTSLLVLLLLLL
jgi:hypothetical protein